MTSNIHPALSRHVSGYAHLCTAGELNRITATHTAFASFEDLLNAPTYRPSLDMSKDELWTLANAYDDAQGKRGDSRRTHRFNSLRGTTGPQD